jgi:hypothetical protein
MSLRRRRRVLGAAMITVLAAIVLSAGVVAADVVSAGRTASPAPAAVVRTVPLAGVPRVPAGPAALATARQVPVLVYHEMDNGCPPAAATCKAGPDYESVSLAQFTAEMAWMHAAGYHTVTLAEYLAWLGNRKTLLPRRPFLITVDNGIGNFLDGAEPVLYHYRYTAAAFLVTGFAAGASGQCAPRYPDPVMPAGAGYVTTAAPGLDVQPGCPAANEHWDLTWAQIRALSPQVYSFGIEAGASGHYLQNYDRGCQAFNACELPGETAAAYEQRVEREYAAGMATLSAELGSRFDPGAWVVPYSDLGYRCEPYSCAYENHDGPRGWLIRYAAAHFEAAFVQDYYRNGIRRERFRYEVHNVTTLRDFRQALAAFLGLRAWAWR